MIFQPRFHMTDTTNQNDEKDYLKPKNMCGICEALGKPPPCLGHGGGGGGGSSGGGEESTKVESSGMENTPAQMSNEPGISGKINYEIGQPLSVSKDLNIETLELLTIYYDNKNGNLIIRGKDGLSEVEKSTLREFLIAVKKEFDEFKNTLETKGIIVDKFHANLKDAELSIHIPNLKYYNEFIQQLQNKNLLPENNVKQQENKAHLLSKDKNQILEEKQSMFSPFKTKPKPK